MGPNGLTAALEPIADQLTTVEAFIVMGDEVGETTLPNAIAYEDLIDGVDPWGAWPLLDERSFTQGTNVSASANAFHIRVT